MTRTESRRFAFDSSLVIDNKATPGAAITALCIEGQRLYLGLDDGVLEGYALPTTPSGTASSLSIRKPIARKTPIMGICAIPQSTTILALTADGIVHTCDGENLQTQQLPFRHVVAISVSTPTATRPPRLAIAVRVNKRTAKFAVYDLSNINIAKTNLKQLWEVVIPDAPEIWGLAWANDSIIIASAHKYLLAAPSRDNKPTGIWRELLELPFIESEGQQPQRPFVAVQSLPWTQQALLAVGEAGVIVGPSGDPIGGALRFDSIPPVRALAAGGNKCVLAICEDGAHVFDPSTGLEIQFLGFGLGIRPVPGQRIHTASSSNTSRDTGTVAVAGRHMVWLFSPVPLIDQARELLARREFPAALELADSTSTMASSSGQYMSSSLSLEWKEDAYAEAALLLLHDCKFEQAIAALDICSPSTFQPVELLPLFPEHAQGLKIPEAVIHREHWGLHPRLESVETIIERYLRRSKQEREEDDDTQNVGSNNNNNKLSSTIQQGENFGRGADDNDGVEKARLRRKAASAIVAYLFRARELQGIAFLPACDTLIFHLLLDLNASDQGTAFASVPNKADISLLQPRLKASQWNAALATLLSVHGETKRAIDLWKCIAAGELPAEPLTSTSTDHRAGQAELWRKEAAEGAVDLLCSIDGDSATATTADGDTLALESLPWLLEASQAAALRLLRARALSPFKVLPMLTPASDARCRYLEWLVSEGGNEDTELHSELAVALSQSALKPEPVYTRDERRARLLRHLETSTLWKPETLLNILRGSDLYNELVAVHSRAGDHAAALRILALTLHDMPAAEEYAVRHLPPSEHGLLLHIVLHPGDNTEPHWEDACHVVATLGTHLDPLDLINQLPAGMPLSAAERVVSPVIRDRVHRKRQAGITSSLNAARLTAQRAQRVEAEGAARVVVDDSCACPSCHLRLGGKVFVVVPNGKNIAGEVLPPKTICFNCWKKSQQKQASRVASISPKLIDTTNDNDDASLT